MAKDNGNRALPGSRNAQRISSPYPGTALPAPAYTPGGRVPVSVWPGPGNYAKSKDGTPAEKAFVDPRPQTDMMGKPMKKSTTWDPMDDCPGD
jgi:hypothetical protein